MNEKELHDALMGLATLPLQDIGRTLKEISIDLQAESKQQLQAFADDTTDAIGLSRVLVEAAATTGAATALAFCSDLMFKLTAQLKAGNL